MQARFALLYALPLLLALSCTEEIIVVEATTEDPPAPPAPAYQELAVSQGHHRRYFNSILTDGGLYVEGENLSLLVQATDQIGRCEHTVPLTGAQALTEQLHATLWRDHISIERVGLNVPRCFDQFSVQLPLDSIEPNILGPKNIDAYRSQLLFSDKYLFYPYEVADDPRLHLAIIEVGIPSNVNANPEILHIERIVLEIVTIDFRYNQYAVPGGIVLASTGEAGEEGTFRISTSGAVTKVHDQQLFKVFSHGGKLYGVHHTGTYDLIAIVVTSTTGEEWTPYLRVPFDFLFYDFKELQDGELVAYLNEHLLHIPYFGPDSVTTVRLNIQEIGTNPIMTVASLDSTLYVGTLSGLFYRDLAEALGDGQ